MKRYLILLALSAVTQMYGQRVEVGSQPHPSVLPTVDLLRIRGYIADPVGARIPNARVTLQKRNGDAFVDVQSFESGQIGEFDFGKMAPGMYQLVATARGFCRITVPIKVSGSGWPGCKIALPIGVSDTPEGYCEDKVKIERLGH